MVGIREILAQLIPPKKAFLMHRSYDLIGDVAVVKLPYELNSYKEEVGTAFHKLHPQVRRVFRVVGETEEIKRGRELEPIWTESPVPGADGDITPKNLGRTIYVEHRCRFVVDVNKVFFTPRLAYERMRIAEQVKPGEVIVNMFGGVGTYAIVAAKVCPKVKRIYTIDTNAAAYELANENININRCAGKVVSILGDAKTVCRGELKGICNRVIMPLPEYASSFLESAALALTEGCDCVVNFYAEVSGRQIEEKVEKVIDETKKKMRECGASTCEATGWRIVREVGQRRYHTAIDLKVLK